MRPKLTLEILDRPERRLAGHSAGALHRRPELVRGTAAAGADELICFSPHFSWERFVRASTLCREDVSAEDASPRHWLD